MAGAGKTPLYETHCRLGGKMVEFAGWVLPVQYTSIIDEHRATRERAGLFDVSHMGEIGVAGPGALEFLQELLPNDIARLEDGGVLYSPLLNEKGGFIDDLLVYRLQPDRYLLVVNAANTERDLDWARTAAGGRSNLVVQDESDRWAQLALQGPRARQVLAKLAREDVDSIGYYRFRPEVEVGPARCLVSRTGYTGEDGFELYCTPQEAPGLWDALLEAGEEEGVVPAGLGARDTLRFEACLPLYGHELDEETTPWEAGLGRFVALEKGIDFIGRDALVAKQEPGRCLVGFEMLDPGIPRTGYELTVHGRKVGQVTSGTRAPSLGKNLGLGYVPVEMAVPGTRVWVRIRGEDREAVIIPTPFYRRQRTRLPTKSHDSN